MLLWTYPVFFFISSDLSKILPNSSLFVKSPSKTYANGTHKANQAHEGYPNSWFSSAVIQNLGYFGHQLFHDGGSYHIETSPLICSANQLTGFYMIWNSVMIESKNYQIILSAINLFERNNICKKWLFFSYLKGFGRCLNIWQLSLLRFGVDCNAHIYNYLLKLKFESCQNWVWFWFVKLPFQQCICVTITESLKLFLLR